MIRDLEYHRLGVRVCYSCTIAHKINVRVDMDMEDSCVLGREVHSCPKCGEMAIGELIPPSLKKFFVDNASKDDDLPTQERITV